MKNVQRNRRRQDHRHTLAAFALTVAGCGLFFSACQKKLDHQFGATDGILRFVVTDTLQWQAGQTAQSTSQLATTSTAPTAAKVEGTLEEGRQMYLRAHVTEGIDLGGAAQQGVVTRAEMTTGTYFHTTLGLYAMEHSGTYNTFSANFMENVQATGSVTSGYSTTTKYYVPTGKTIQIFSQAPYLSSSTTNGLSKPTVSGQYLVYNFETPRWIADQKDICFAQASVSSSNSTATLNYEHAMAAIRFKIDASVEDCHIDTIVLTGVGSVGTVTPHAATGWWSVPTTPKEFSYTGPSGIDHTSGTTTDVFGTDNASGAQKAFFLIPQSIRSIGVRIHARNSKGTTKTLTASLPGSDWSRGKTYTYTLSFNLVGDVNLTVNPVTTSLSETGGDFKFNVTSERDGTFVPYKVQYKKSNNTWADLNTTDYSTMITGSSATGSGTTRTHLLTTPEEYRVQSTYRDQLYNATSQGSQNSPVNLAAGKASANCYIVSAPGWYQIPIVYGNALSSGTVGSETNNGNVLYKYTNALGNSINDPWIKTSAFPDLQQVLWQDAQGLVRNVSATGDGKYLKFYVDKATIQEGNAVIGVLDSNPKKVLWSWHIWVTTKPETITVQRNASQSGSTTMMFVPLGYVHPGTAIWDQESLTIRFIPQDPDNASQYLEGSASQEITITKSGAQRETPGRYPTYQWGRKDPQLPITTSSTAAQAAKNAPVYPGIGGDKTYLPSTSNRISSLSIAEWIKNPHAYYTASGTVLPYLWNATLTTASQTSVLGSSTKSLYDPAPAGYKVPTAGSFDDLVRDIDAWSAGTYLVPEPNVNTGTGGYGLDISSFDLWKKTYGTEASGAGYGYGFAKFWTYSNRNPSTDNYRQPWKIPLLGGRAVSNNFQAGLYGNHAFYWMTGKPKTSTGYCLGMYIDNKGYRPWIDVMGVSPQDGLYAGFLIGDQRNSYAIIPQIE